MYMNLLGFTSMNQDLALKLNGILDVGG